MFNDVSFTFNLLNKQLHSIDIAIAMNDQDESDQLVSSFVADGFLQQYRRNFQRKASKVSSIQLNKKTKGPQNSLDENCPLIGENFDIQNHHK